MPSARRVRARTTTRRRVRRVGRSVRGSFRTKKRGRRGIGVGYKFSRWALPTSNTMSLSSGTVLNAGGRIETTTAVTETDLAMIFRLDDMPNVSEFVNLFDNYRVRGVKITIKMVSNPDAQSIVGSATTNVYANYFPTLWWTTDEDDVNLVTLVQMREYAKARHRVLKPNQEISIFVRPKPLQAMFKGLTTGYALGKASQWLDLANADIPLYGVKLVIDYEGMTTSALNPWYFKFNTKYYFETKTVR